eukprot:scaffold137477_cov32-Tisochrysis_lutea.AAC.2
MYREILQVIAVDDHARVPEDTVLDPLALRVDDGQQTIRVHLRAYSAESGPISGYNGGMLQPLSLVLEPGFAMHAETIRLAEHMHLLRGRKDDDFEQLRDPLQEIVHVGAFPYVNLVIDRVEVHGEDNIVRRKRYNR